MDQVIFDLVQQYDTYITEFVNQYLTVKDLRTLILLNKECFKKSITKFKIHYQFGSRAGIKELLLNRPLIRPTSLTKLTKISLEYNHYLKRGYSIPLNSSTKVENLVYKILANFNNVNTVSLYNTTAFSLVSNVYKPTNVKAETLNLFVTQFQTSKPKLQISSIPFKYVKKLIIHAKENIVEFKPNWFSNCCIEELDIHCKEIYKHPMYLPPTLKKLTITVCPRVNNKECQVTQLSRKMRSPPLTLDYFAFFVNGSQKERTVLEYFIPLFQQRIIKCIKVLRCPAFEFIEQELDDWGDFIEIVEY